MKKYKVLSDIEHVLLRPTMYIGSIKETLVYTYLYDLNSITIKEFNLNTFLYKLFDEIITNSIDEYKRGFVNEIKVNITKDNNDIVIEIYDNGGIEVEYYDNEKLIPEILFSQLRSSSNFDSYNEELVGTFGVGATLVNIFSKYFEVITSKNKKLYKGIWKDNMSNYNKEISNSNTNFTKITFIPDLKRFDLSFKEDDIYFLYRRIFDYKLFLNNLNFYINDKKIDNVNFDMISKIDYISETKNYKFILFEPLNVPLQESFVNLNWTLYNGHHIDYLIDLLYNKFKIFQKHLIKNNISYFFNLNTKDILFSSQDKFKYIGSYKPNIYLDKITETKTYFYLKSLTEKREIQKEKKISFVNFVPPMQKENTILFITEGLSASLVGKSLKNKNMAFFALKGKCINTLEKNPNKELRQLHTIIKDYNFDKICIMTDQDYDGDSIASLLFLFFYMYLKDYINKIYKFKAPLIIVDKNIYFDNLEQFENYKKPYKEIKYCKGLGSYSNEDFKVFFNQIDKHLEKINFDDCEDLLQNLFKKSNSKWRKLWLLQ